MYVAGEPEKSIPEQAKKAFTELESAFTSFRGRKFYGVITENEYRACSSITASDEQTSLPHRTMIIPGGKYIRTKIDDWQKHTEQIAQAFDELYELPNVDPSRPAIEYYRTVNELEIMVPIE
ncbi:MAG: effector binding domain-containing protein [Flavobacteriaceae bacterium]|nr:effector binding domain-containing protein [Flavobacteriaceae bacterium]